MGQRKSVGSVKLLHAVKIGLGGTFDWLELSRLTNGDNTKIESLDKHPQCSSGAGQVTRPSVAAKPSALCYMKTSLTVKHFTRETAHKQRTKSSTSDNRKREGQRERTNERITPAPVARACRP